MIHIIDYGVGNIQAILTMYKSLNISAQRATCTADLLDAASLVLPGVGHFDHAMNKLNDSGLRPIIEELVFGKKIPIIGICVGMQMLASGSDEGNLPGLNWIPGRVRSFASSPIAANLPMPHMGWNTLNVNPNSELFSTGFTEKPQFYFLHSYYFDATDKSNVMATANYGIEFDVVVSSGNIHGIQCHPEKSHRWGARLLKNFSEL
jgi:glutamine amidotransferase